MVAPSNDSFYGRANNQWDCDWVFSFPRGHYTKVNSHHPYVKNKLASFGNCGMKARYIGSSGSWNGRTELILGSSPFFPVDMYWVQRQLRMGK